MEALHSMWAFESESTEELKQKLLEATLELETANKLKMELFDLLNIVYHERDELKEELSKVLHNLATSSPNIPEDAVPQVFPEGLVIVAANTTTKANSSITESNSFSYGTPDSFLDAVSSPDFSNFNSNVGVVETTEYCDPASVVIESLVRGKVLPEKGKLLQAVMESGPLLQTLLVAGPLPSWRNPPPILPIKVPPFAFNKDFDSSASFSCVDDVKPQISPLNSASVLNFAGNNGNSPYGSLNYVNYQVPASKRQRV